MRKIVYTNPNGGTITLGEETYGILSLEGTGVPSETLQSQRAPFQDGSTYIDTLLEPREIVVQCTINVGGDASKIYEHRRLLSAGFNPKAGPGTLVYTNDYGSWMIQGSPVGPIFANWNATDGQAKFQITFNCNDPYWQDVTETTVTVAKGSADAVVNIIGDVAVPVKIDMTGRSKNPTITEKIQNKLIKYEGITDQRITVDTAFGNKTAVMNYSGIWRMSAFSAGDVCYDGSLTWCSIGRGKSIETSVDKINWTLQSTTPSAQYFYAVSYSNQLRQWCVVGEDGLIFTSPDSITWTEMTSGTTQDLYGVVYNTVLKLWFAVGYGGTILASSDGITWAPKTSGTTQIIYSIAFNTATGLLCATGTSGVILTSEDGTNWTTRASGTSTRIDGVAYSETLDSWCAVSESLSLISTDGVTWNSYPVAISPAGYYTAHVVYNSFNSLWYAVGANGMKTSADGIAWESVGSTALVSLYFDNSGSGVSVGDSVVVYTNNSTSWTTLFYGTPLTSSIAYSNAGLLWCSVGSIGSIRTSPDGKIWTARTSGVSDLLKDAYYSEEQGLWCVAGGKSIITSSDAITWTLRYTLGLYENLECVYYSSVLNQWIAAGINNYNGNGIVCSSVDGVTWVKQNGTLFGIYGLHYSNLAGIWCMVGNSGKVYTSPDGTNWTLRTSGTSNALNSVSFSEVDGLWCAVGASGTIITSENGIDWTTRTSGTSSEIKSVIYNNETEEWIACSATGLVLTSADAITWVVTNLNYGRAFNKVATSRTLKTTVLLSTTLFESNDQLSQTVIQNLSKDTTFFQLQPGRNVLSAATSAGGMTATVKYRNRYIGV